MRLELGGAAQQDLSLVLGVTGAIAVTFVTLGGVMLLYVRQRKAALRCVMSETISRKTSPGTVDVCWLAGYMKVNCPCLIKVE